jgi:hypothetical protein
MRGAQLKVELGMPSAQTKWLAVTCWLQSRPYAVMGSVLGEVG